MAPVLAVASEPMAELNTTPLIDVLLVLLVMFILSIPAVVHQIDFPLPQADTPPSLAKMLSQNQITLSAASQISWNGQAVSEGQLLSLLNAATHSNPEPLIRYAPDSGAPYGRALHVLNLIKASDPAAFAFSGNEQYADFGRAVPSRR